jgi:nucleoside-diphosphate-sugar epimerase
MILGRGLLAQAFIKADDKFSDTLVIAAGVSNSISCTNADFEREEVFLLNQLAFAKDRGLKTLYFGTTSIYDPLKMHSAYVQHKIRMEQLQASSSSAYILRLPNIVGRSENPNTLVNYLVNAIENGLEYQAFVRQLRYLIDVEWVPMVARELLDKRLQIENMTLNDGINVGSLIAMIERILNKKSHHINMKDENDFKIPVSDQFISVIEGLGLPWKRNFEFDLLKKYLN